MATFKMFREIALSLPETAEAPHFEKTSFRVKGKIFATYDIKGGTACVKLSEADQSKFVSRNGDIVYPVDNKWGKQGWTLIELDKIKKDLFTDILMDAYCGVAPKKIAQAMRLG